MTLQHQLKGHNIDLLKRPNGIQRALLNVRTPTMDETLCDAKAQAQRVR